MSNGTMACPECGHANATPEAGTKKITCVGCGMIIVMAKIYGADWAAKAAGPARPKIVTRRDRSKTPTPEVEAEPAGRGRKPSRGGRKTRGKAPVPGKGHAHGHGHDHDGHPHHYHSPKETSPALVWGSVAGILIVGVLVGVVLKHNSDKEALRKEKEQAGIASREKPAEKQPIPDIDALADDLDIPAPTPGDEKPAAGTDKPAEKKPTKKPSVEPKSYDPFPTDGIDAAAKAEIEAAIAVLKDLDATTELRPADNKLFEHRAAAIPMLINALLELKLDDEADVKRGWSLVQSLGRCSEHRTTWEMEFNIMEWPEDAEAVAKGARNRSIMLKMWYKWWLENGEGWEPPVEDESFFDD